MGILGEIPRAEMIKITGEVAKWQAADSTTTAIPLCYIAVTAQGAPGQHKPHAHAVQTNR
jgi:hypothetical protein